MPIGVTPNQEFLKFISIHDGKKNFPNLDLLLNLERDRPGIFTKVMSNFDEAKSYRDSLDEQGKPIKVSWEDALRKFYLHNRYLGTTPENIDIAELFETKGLSQKAFDMAKELREEAINENVPEHILGKAIKEETILENIERIKNETEQELPDVKEMVERLYDKQFTYEWLNKNDPHNAILGLFCTCCGTITSFFYGKNIAKASIVAPDVQNLVIRDFKGNIISKGTMYVNKDKGYAVINDFELNQKYRNHENSSGRYEVEETSPEEQDREMIFKAFQRGVGAFVEEYNKQNPEKPLTQVNVGMGHNRLKKQVERLKEATSNLSVPPEYSFEDAMQNEQYILYYKKPEKQMKIGGVER